MQLLLGVGKTALLKTSKYFSKKTKPWLYAITSHEKQQ